MVESSVKQLIDMTIQKNMGDIRTFLEEYDINQKGKLFERYLVELFKGNGWLTYRNGGKNDGGADILIYHPKQPQKVFMIIQAKNYNRKLTVDEIRTELIKFEEESKEKYNCNNYSLITINGFVSNCNKFSRYMNMESWEYLEKYINDFNQDTIIEPKIELYAHNNIAYNNSKTILKESNKVAFVQATGSGKSYIIIKYFLDFIGKRIILLAPSTYIIEQIKEKYLWISEVVEFTTYAKLKNIDSNLIKDYKYDLIVLDEFHRCGAKSWGKGVERLLENNKQATIIGTSATPIRYLDNKRDMSDELFEGKVASNISLAEAIAREILPIPIYISALYTLNEEIEKLTKRLEKGSLDKQIKEKISIDIRKYQCDWENTNGIPKILKKYINSDMSKFIVFCENKEHLYEMEWLLEKWFKCSNISNKIRKYRITSDEIIESKKNLEEFKVKSKKWEIKLLFAIDMLNEGIHIGDIDGVILLRKTKSPRIFYQQIGRAIEVGKAKHPLIFDFVSNMNSICTKEFLEDLLSEKVKEDKIRKKLGLETKKIDFTILDETKDAVDLFKEIDSRLESQWEYWFEKLVEFKNNNGTCFIEEGRELELRKWCDKQRGRYSKGSLTDEQIKRLNSIEFIWDLKEYKWFISYEKLKEFKRINGHCNVPRHYSDKQFAYWIDTQRKRTHMTKERELLLDKLGFNWGFDDVWLRKFNVLKEYKEKFGDCIVPNVYMVGDFNLSRWLKYQISAIRGQTGCSISQERIKMLDDLGALQNRRDDNWERMLQEYIKHRDDTGRDSVLRDENSKLSNWCSRQRINYKKDKLYEERMKKLQEIGFKFEV